MCMSLTVGIVHLADSELMACSFSVYYIKNKCLVFSVLPDRSYNNKRVL